LLKGWPVDARLILFLSDVATRPQERQSGDKPGSGEGVPGPDDRLNAFASWKRLDALVTRR